MKFNHLLIITLLALLGIATIFMPWIEYPTLKLTLYGSDGDGSLFSIVFFIIASIGIISLFRKKDRLPRWSKIIIAFLSSSIFLICSYKIYTFQYEVAHFQSESPIIGYAGSGARLSYGLFVIAILSCLIAIISLFENSFARIRNIALLILAILTFTFATVGVNHLINMVTAPDKNEQIVNLESAFDQMSTALIEKRSNDFVDYIHPILYQSVGGKNKLAQLMAGMYASISIENSEIVNIKALTKKGNNIQALVFQKFTFKTNNEISTSQTSSIAFSYDNGVTWVFAATENKPFKEMKQVLPEIFDELQY